MQRSSKIKIEQCNQRREEKGFYFFKIIHSSRIQDRRLSIPNMFIRNFEKELSDFIVLKVPSGKQWHVELREEEGRVWFRKGWDTFIDYYAIGVGHILVFKYDGNSQFNVVICDMRGSEIEYPCEANNLKEANNETGSQTSKQNNLKEDIIEILDFCPLRQVVDEFQDHTTRKHSMIATQQSCFSLQSIATTVKRVATTSNTDLGFYEQRTNISKNDSSCHHKNIKKQDEDTEEKSKYLVRNEKKRTEQVLNNDVHFKVEKVAEDDLFGVNCRSYGETTMFTPTKFTYTSDIGSEQDSDPCAQFLNRPRAFVHDRETEIIPEGCELFGYIFKDTFKGDPLDFDCLGIHEQTSSHPQGLTLMECSSHDSHQMKNVEGLRESPSFPYSDVQLHVSNSKKSKIIEADLYCSKKEVRKRKASDLQPEQQTELVPLLRRPVTFQVKERSITEASAFTSENPFCSVTMRPSYVHNNFLLNFPIWFARTYLKDVQGVTLWVPGGRVWSVRCALGDYFVKLSTGWKAFVLDNQLAVDDICIFELVNRQLRKLKVSIFRVHQKSSKEEGLRQSPSFPYSDIQIHASNSKKSKIVEAGLYCSKGEDRKRKFSNLQAKQQTELVPLLRRPVPFHVRERSTTEASAFTSENPFCTVTMRPSYVHGRLRLNLPILFARTYLKDVQGVTLWVPDGRVWPVQCALGDYHVKLSTGWKAFVLDNQLAVGDICIFELVDIKLRKLKVSIFRVHQNSSQEKAGISKRLTTYMEKERRITSPNTFTSVNPFCTVRMRPSYVRATHARVNLPRRFAKKYLKDAFPSVTLRISNRGKWTVKCQVGHCCKLGKGWRTFAVDNHLKEDDVCIFELVHKNPIELNVSIFPV